MEEWREILEFPDYAVSNEGRIMRIRPDYFGKAGKILKPHLRRYAYLTLYLNHKPYVVLVHRIACIAFHGLPPTPEHQVAHYDGNGYNNHHKNLRWATGIENEADKIRHGTNLAGRPSWVPIENRARGITHGRHTNPERTARGEQCGTSKLTAVEVINIRKDSRSRKEIAAEYGITRTMVGYIIRGKSWKHIPTQMETNNE